MAPVEASTRSQRVVCAHACEKSVPVAEHEKQSLLGFASRVAALLGHADGGLYDAGTHGGACAFFVPDATLTSAQAASLGISGMDHLFGGVVPHAFVGTKAISHPLVGRGAVGVPGWNEAFARRIEPLVLAGYTVFDVADACEAGARLLARGPVRVKPVQAKGGLGQAVASDHAALAAALHAIDADDMGRYGVVLEEDLEEVVTFSVGQVRVGPTTASYVGTQRRTRNNHGESVFGGSDLSAVRGGFEQLLASAHADEVRGAIAQALRFHEAAHACYPGLYASRANYDVLLGRDTADQMRCAVLEQSWRVGGATGAEIAVLEAFLADPSRQQARASCFEVFGEGAAPPPGATVYFDGSDPQVGRLAKFTVLHPDDRAH